MATPIPQAYIDNFLDIVKSVSYLKYQQIQSILVNYEDIATAIGILQPDVEASPYLLTQLMASFPDIRPLNDVGIYLNQSSSSPLNITYTGPNLIINCQYTGGVVVGFIPSPPTSPLVTTTDSVCLFNGSIVKGGVTINSVFVLFNLYLGSGTWLDYLDSTATNSFVNLIILNNVNTSPATLLNILNNSNFGTLKISNGAVFGGIGVPLDNTCSAYVTGLTATQGAGLPATTHNTLMLTWDLPVENYINISVFYRPSQSPDWILATTNIGDWIGKQTGFIFRELKSDTYYDFQVILTCNNGGVGTPVQLLAQPTSSSQS